jgi:hypothetical protein
MSRPGTTTPPSLSSTFRQKFLQSNVIAAEIEKVIRSITARDFSRDEFVKPSTAVPFFSAEWGAHHRFDH